MGEEFIRSEMVLGTAAMERLSGCRVAVFGLGGVGGCAAEGLVRSGIGALDLIDHDRVSLSNLNRQIIATHSTVGMRKVEAAAKRFLDINPDLRLQLHPIFLSPETVDAFDFAAYDYVVDAIDTVTAKLCLILRAKAAETPIICSMGTGNKLDPSQLTLTDLSKTSMDPLARVMRRELRRRGVTHLKVLCSTEEPNLRHRPQPESAADSPADQPRKAVPGSTSFVPTAAGFLIASAVVRDLVGDLL